MPRTMLTPLVTLAALLLGGCATSPLAPTSSSEVSVRTSAPQVGTPPPRDSLGTIPALGATRFMAFGDSITEGVLSSFDASFLFRAANGQDYPAQLDALLEASFPMQDFTVENRGVGGDTAAGAVAGGRFAAAMAASRPQGLLLLMGINDLNGGASIASAVGALQQMVELARLYNTTVLVGTMFQTCRSVDPMTGRVRLNSFDRIVAFDDGIRAMAAGRQNVHVVDVYGAFGNNCVANGGTGLLGGDGLHPSLSGYQALADVFGRAIRDRFPVRGSFQ